jgi:ABC-2 type transport system permease protein
MVGGINYIVAQRAPLVAWLNPAARIADAFYCLYYYDNYERYFMNIGIILGLTIVMFLIAAAFLRRSKFKSV